MFDRALGFVLGMEGGYADNPSDPGGKTMAGVTQKTYDDWRVSNGLPTRDVQQLTVIELRRLYGQMWEDGRCDEMPDIVALVYYDAVVNHGPVVATKFLQRIVGAAPDGEMGPLTMNSVKSYCIAPGDATLVAEFLAARESLYRALADNPDRKQFLAGWLSRLHRLEAEVHAFTEAP